MGVFTYEEEVTSTVPAHRLFKAIALESDIIIPKVAPHAIKSSEIIEGDGGPGSIKKITFAEGSQFKYVKHKIEKLDKESFTYGYTIIDGDALAHTLEKISYETKFVPIPDGGCICKGISKYYTKGDFEIKEEDIKVGKEKARGMFKAIEAYLLANPDA
ncbi:hypothetical protein P3X46_005911 [Hevea brasiliensis]|uniref:Bet v I/Major latex protein domain-containing protein n=1 Tax=Hevea brasiliensis TaxID=3981 RepID=A0ABQ9MNI4_HEVBR|nr:major allergen Pru av 1 [Hevea brasiliensis]KAJ9181864.1 hypothetical protein P3X46_005911 [Hevea brasiliensis]